MYNNNMYEISLSIAGIVKIGVLFCFVYPNTAIWQLIFIIHFVNDVFDMVEELIAK